MALLSSSLIACRKQKKKKLNPEQKLKEKLKRYLSWNLYTTMKGCSFAISLKITREIVECLSYEETWGHLVQGLANFFLWTK
jgi:hypothetical protein